MCGGVPYIGRDGVETVSIDHGAKPSFDLAEGFFPTHLLETAFAANQGHAKAIRVVVERAEGGALGADIASAPNIIGVRPNTLDPSFPGLDPKAAHGLA